MPSTRSETLIHSLRGFVSRQGTHASDRDLLGAFVATRNEAAFEQLVRRYGSMVMGVCRRTLGGLPDAEDAFQATFLILARRAGQIGSGEKLAGWLYTTAQRVAFRARGLRARRTEREQSMTPLPQTPIEPVESHEELLAELDREIGRLPAKYRLAVVLCEIQGRSRFEVARELGIAEGTLSSRLAAARKLLAQRLARHRPTLTLAGLSSLLSPDMARAFPPIRLIESTARVAAPFAAAQTVPPALLSPAAVSLAEGVMRIMYATKLKMIVALFAIPMLAGFAISPGAGPATITAPLPRPIAAASAPQPVAFVAQTKTPDDKKEPTKKTELPKDAAPETLKARLEKYDNEINKIREAMFKEVEAEEKRLDAVIAKGEAEHEAAMKNKDFEAAAKAFKAQSLARAEKVRLQLIRFDLDRRVRPSEPPAPTVGPDERLGLRLSSPGSVIATQLGLEKNQGLVIDSVKADSPAGKLGLQVADILVKVDGKPVPANVGEFRKMLTELKDATVEVVVLRKGKPETVKGFQVPAPTPRG